MELLGDVINTQKETSHPPQNVQCRVISLRLCVLIIILIIVLVNILATQFTTLLADKKLMKLVRNMLFSNTSCKCVGE